MRDESERLRSHPSQRFEGPSHLLDIDGLLTELRAEPHAAQHGHRQVTVYHRAPVTKALFAFETGGFLADHAARGLVTIHALEGRLTVQAAEESYELKAGTILVLSPQVRHSVRAEEVSAMLLTVHLETGAGSSGASG